MTANPTESFAALVAADDDDIDVERGAFLIAAHARPDLDLATESARIDTIAAGCTERSLGGLRRHLFVDLGFAGNGIEYDDPRNSFLDQVVTRRVGLPITLSVLTIAVGRRLGLDLFGVGMPAHYMVGVGDGTYIDPFYGGDVLDVDGCAALFARVAGSDVAFDPRWLAPASPRSTLARMLANLKNVYLTANDVSGATWVLRLRTLLPDSPPEEQAQLAALLAGRGQARAAARELEQLADRLPVGRADRARHRAALLRASLN